MHSSLKCCSAVHIRAPHSTCFPESLMCLHFVILNWLPTPPCTDETPHEAGSVYTINADASAPFDTVQGQTYTVIQSTPVLNGPFAYNGDTLSLEDVKAIQELFTSDEVANDRSNFSCQF